MVMRKVEEALGLPSLTKVAESIEKFPDEKRLKLIKEVLVVAEKVAQNALALDQVVDLIREINSMPMEKLEKLEKVLGRIERIISKAPEDLMKFLSNLREE